MDSPFVKAQFESAMKMVKYAVSVCADLEDPELARFMRRELIEQERFLERRVKPKAVENMALQLR